MLDSITRALAVMAAAALAGAFVFAGSARAGAWTKDKGEGLAIYTLSLHRLLPMEGGYDRLKNEAALYGEYGLTDRITLVGRAAWQTMEVLETFTEEVSYAVEVKPPYDPLRDDPDADYDGDGVTNRNDPPPQRAPIYEQRSKFRHYTLPPETGVGGLQAGMRYRLYQQGRWAVSVQGVAGIPGTGENRNNHRFGEGGGSFDLRIQGGRSFGRSTFANAALGVRSLPGERSDEVRLDLAAGTHVMRGVRVMAQTYSVWSLGDGPANLHGYSGHRAQLSVLWPIDDVRRAQIAALATFDRTNMSRETALMASIWRTF